VISLDTALVAGLLVGLIALLWSLLNHGFDEIDRRLELMQVSMSTIEISITTIEALLKDWKEKVGA
jgi:nitrogen fixation-related uncharacterized protein